MEEMKDKCGVFGVWGAKDAANLCYLGLYALQHRGQESAGIVSKDGSRFYVAKHMGLVSDVFTPEMIKELKGTSAIGHVRYSTTGSSDEHNIQPLYSKTSKGKFAIAHNGNLTNAHKYYTKLKKEGALFQSTVDSEVLLHLVARSKSRSIVEAVRKELANIEGAFSLVSLTDSGLIAARDPNGFRPLVLGRLKDSYIVCSETCALDLIGATYEREIEPGELVFIDDSGLSSFKIPSKMNPAFCIFEHVYFARPDSIIFGDSVHEVRKEMGRQLARECQVDADLVMAIPDSGNSAALGYAQESMIPYEIGMTRNHYVGRTFIQPSQKIRDLSVKVKLNPIHSVIKGKKIIVIDDSIVRGTTSKQRVAALRKAGAKEIHMRISSPPITDPCHMGIDTPSKDQLVGAHHTVDEICKMIGADSLAYISKKGMLNSVFSVMPDHFCTACFDGRYPIKIPKRRRKHAFEDDKIKQSRKKVSL